MRTWIQTPTITTDITAQPWAVLVTTTGDAWPCLPIAFSAPLVDERTITEDSLPFDETNDGQRHWMLWSRCGSTYEQLHSTDVSLSLMELVELDFQQAKDKSAVADAVVELSRHPVDCVYEFCAGWKAANDRCEQLQERWRALVKDVADFSPEHKAQLAKTTNGRFTRTQLV